MGNVIRTGTPDAPPPRASLARATPRRGDAVPAQLFNSPDPLSQPPLAKTASVVAEDAVVIQALDAVRIRYAKKLGGLQDVNNKLKAENEVVKDHATGLTLQLDETTAELLAARDDNFTLASALCISTAEEEAAKARVAAEREAVRAEILALRRLLNRKGGQALDRLRDEVAQYKDHQIAEAKAFVASVSKVLDDLLDRTAVSPPAGKAPKLG